LGFVPQTALSFQDRGSSINNSFSDGQWYGRVSGGYVFHNETDLSWEGYSTTWDGDGGWSIHAALGYRFDPNWGLDFEFGYTSLSHETINEVSGADSLVADADFTNWTFLVGPRLSFDISPDIEAFIGGHLGVGIGHGEVNGTLVYQGVTYTGSSSDTAAAFAYGMRAGIGFAFSPRVHGEVNFRLDHSTAYDFSGIDATPLTMSIEAGVNIAF